MTQKPGVSLPFGELPPRFVADCTLESYDAYSYEEPPPPRLVRGSPMSRFSTPIEPDLAVVMAGESPTPELRHQMRQLGAFIPPHLARLMDGPALIVTKRQFFRWETGPAQAQPAEEWNESWQEGAPEQAWDTPAPHESNPGYYPEQEEYDAYQDDVGDSTTQATHEVERLDLSDWGYLVRVVYIASNTIDPNQAFESLKPTIGSWLHSEIQEPNKLEYDRRFRQEIEKALARFLTESIGRIPVIKTDIQFIE